MTPSRLKNYITYASRMITEASLNWPIEATVLFPQIDVGINVVLACTTKPK